MARGDTDTRPFRYRHFASLAYIGGDQAAVDIPVPFRMEKYKREQKKSFTFTCTSTEQGGVHGIRSVVALA